MALAKEKQHKRQKSITLATGLQGGVQAVKQIVAFWRHSV